MANGADMQGLAVIEGRGVEFVLTLGTGLGSAPYLDGDLGPNLEIAHRVFRKNRAYEQYSGKAGFKRLGRRKWNVRLRQALVQLENAFNYRRT